MKKHLPNLKIKEINKKITNSELNSIINLIKNENVYSILSKLSISLIKKYLRILILNLNTTKLLTIMIMEIMQEHYNYSKIY